MFERLKTNILTPDYALEFVAKHESAIKSSVPASFYDEYNITPFLRNKTEVMLDFEAISCYSKICNP